MWKFLKKDPIRLGAILLALSSLLSRVLGLARDLVFSSIFGLGTQGGKYALEAYFVAFKIPDFLYTLLIFGAMSAAFIPLYAELKKKQGEESAARFASQVLTGLMGILFIFSASAWLLAPWLIPHLAQAYTPEVQSLAVTLTRIMLLSPIFMGLSSILQGIENTHKSFWGTALAPLLYNASIIGSALLFGADYGVYALAYGVAVGALLHFLVQLPGTLRSGFRYRFTFKKEDLKWKEFLKLTFPRLLGTSAIQLSSFADVFMAGFLTAGSLSVYSYTFNLQSLPYGVVAVAVSTAIFASLSEQADEKEEFIKSMKKSLSHILFWVLPAIVGLFLIREPLIEFLLQRGAFDAEATQRTSAMLAFFVWAALPQSFIPLFTRAFYALKKTAYPVLCACIAMIFCVTFNGLGIWVFKGDVNTLALGNGLGALLNASLLYWGLVHHLNIPFLRFIDLKKTSLQILAVLLMAAVLFLASSLHVLIQIALAGFVYLGSVSLLKLRPSTQQDIVA